MYLSKINLDVENEDEVKVKNKVYFGLRYVL